MDRMTIEGMNFSEYVSIDDGITTSEFEPIIANITETVEEVVDSDETEAYDLDSNDSEEIVKSIEAMTAISTLRRYLYQTDGDIDNSLQMLDKIEKNIFKTMSNTKQSKINGYFVVIP